MATAQAAALVLANDEPGRPAPTVEAARRELAAALEQLDEPTAQAVLDRLMASATVEALLSDVVLPFLRELGEGWEQGRVPVAQEHFASNVIRGRLLGLARGWGRGVGPLALLACLPGEQHDIGLLAFGIALRAHGWRILFLGPDTPLDTLAQAAEAARPALVVVSAITWERVAPVATELQRLAHERRLALGGAAAASPEASRLDLLLLPGDPVAEAARIAAQAPQPETDPGAA